MKSRAAKSVAQPKSDTGAAPKPVLANVLADLRRRASKQYRADMTTRYGIVTRAEVYGTPMAQLKLVAKKIGRDHTLAKQLWASGVHDARMLATLVEDPVSVTAAQMDRWARDFDNWAIVDTVTFNVFDRSLHAFPQIQKWAKAKDEFVKRAAFALLASCALHGHGNEGDHSRGLTLIEREAQDPRKFVKKGVSWALRAYASSKSAKVRRAARGLAQRLAQSSDPTARWLGKDALKTFARVKT